MFVKKYSISSSKFALKNKKTHEIIAVVTYVNPQI